MIDLTELKANVATLKGDVTGAVALLKQVRDQNVELAAKLEAAVSGSTDAAVQAEVNSIAGELKDTATTIETATAANPATPDLPPAPIPQPQSDT